MHEPDTIQDASKSDTYLAELALDLEKIKISPSDKLEDLITKSDSFLSSNQTEKAYPLIKEMLDINSKDTRVIEVCRKIIASSDTSHDLSLPQTLISQCCDQTLKPQARLEAIKKLNSLSIQANSVFTKQLAKVGGAVILIEGALELINQFEAENLELIQLFLKALCYLTLTVECLEQMVKNLVALNLTKVSKLDSSLIILITELLQSALVQIQKEKTPVLQNCELPLFNILLVVVLGGYLDHGFVLTKKCFLHVLQLVQTEEYALSVIKHEFFSEVLMELVYETDDEKRGLGLIIINKLHQHLKEPKKLENLLEKKFESLQEQVHLLNSYRFLKSILQTLPKLGIKMVSVEGWLSETVDLIQLDTQQAQCEFIELLGLCCGSTEGRKLISSVTSEYLRIVSKKEGNDSIEIRAQAVLVRSKLSIEEKPENLTPKMFTDLVEPLIKIIIDSETKLDLRVKLTAIESLAYFSLHPSVKKRLGSDKNFWISLVQLGLSDKAQSTSLYGISAIVSNTLAYRKMLTQEQEQLKKLKKLAKEATPTIDESEDPNMAEDEVKKRNSFLASIPGFLGLLSHLVKTKKPNIWALISLAYLSLATNKANHGLLLKFGTVKALVLMSSSENVEIVLTSVQALCKIAIHNNPLVAFPGQLKFEIIRPMLQVCLTNSKCYSAASLLQQFESLMALTNIASAALDLRQRIFDLKAIPSIELLMLSQNAMVQRAATELFCNMTQTQAVFDLYHESQTRNRLHTLMALSDSEDSKTSIAASGALAILSQSPIITSELIKLPSCIRIIPLLISSDNSRDIQHRAVEIIRNILVNHFKSKQTTKDELTNLISPDVITRLKALDREIAQAYPPMVEPLKIIFEALNAL